MIVYKFVGYCVAPQYLILSEYRFIVTAKIGDHTLAISHVWEFETLGL